MNAPLEVKLSVLTKTRTPSELWKQTTTSTETFVLNTDLDSHVDAIEPLITQVWNYTLLQRTNIFAEAGVHFTLTIKNVTAPPPPTGGLVQPKQHFDGALSDGDFNSADALRQRLLTAIQSIKTVARY